MAPTRSKRHSTTIQIPVSSADPWGAQLGEFKESAYRDSSNWNSLLRWHRRNRGPQWDYSTAMYHVDVGSKEFFGGVEPAVPVIEPESAPAAAPERVGVKIETDKLDSPERPSTASTRGAQQLQQTQNRPTSSSSVSANNAGQLASFPPMPASSLSTSGSTGAANMQTKNIQYQQPQQYMAPAAASPSAEMRQHYEAMFHANRQRAASQQAQQQQQQQQFSQGGAGSPPQQRMPPGPAYSPPPGLQQQQTFFQQPNQQAMYQSMMASQQMFRPPGQLQPQQMQQQQQQIDPRALFQQPQ